MSDKKYIYEETKGRPIKHWTQGVPLEPQARQQLHDIASMPFIHKHIAVMPDVHLGIGATVGSVIATKGAIIPASVGVDLGCLDADTEFLSPDGWVKISDWSDEDVLQFDPVSGKSIFVKPLAYIKKPETHFYHLKHTKGLDQKVCKQHKILFYKGYDRANREYSIEIAEDFVNSHKPLPKGRSGGFATTYPNFRPNTPVPWSDDVIRVQVMISADGCLRRNADGSDGLCEIHVKKARKIKRAGEILSGAGITYKKYNHKDGSVTLSFVPPHFSKSLSFAYHLTKTQCEVFFDEIFRWDGHYHKNKDQRTFSTNVKENADAVQHVGAVLDTRMGIQRVEYKNENWEDSYQVYTTLNKFVNMSPNSSNPIEIVESEDGFSYCFTVPSGFFVARRNGNIFVTGNCGMSAIKLSLSASDLPDNLHAIRCAIEASVPHGRTDNGGANDRGAWGTPPDLNVSTWSALQSRYNNIIAKHPKAHSRNGVKQLGTLGTGNHFIEVCLDENQNVWVMLHSGSRGVGNRIGSYFIEKAKQEMERYHIAEYLPNKDLSYLVEHTEIFDDYVNAVDWAQDYASANRRIMMESTLQALRKYLPEFTVSDIAVNCHHNYISRENHFGSNVIVTRKGAVRARRNELGIIPGSMGTGSFIVRGLGNKDSFCSCSHGAGRVMSRGEAKRKITVEDHTKAMKGVEARLDTDVLDESPAAYKDIGAVMDAQDDLVEIVYRLKQIINVKG